VTENIQSITVGYAAEHLPKHALVIDFEAYQKLERKLSEAQTLLESAVGPGTDGGGSIIIALQLLRAAAENWDDSQASRNTGRAEAAWATVSEYIKQQQATVRASLLPQQQRTHPEDPFHRRWSS
jgi:hypothetical protein